MTARSRALQAATTMNGRLEIVVTTAIAANIPPKSIVKLILDQLNVPTRAVIDQGCVALRSHHRRLQEAKWSGDRLALPTVKMAIRWKAMISAIKAGM